MSDTTGDDRAKKTDYQQATRARGGSFAAQHGRAERGAETRAAGTSSGGIPDGRFNPPLREPQQSMPVASQGSPLSSTSDAARAGLYRGAETGDVMLKPDEEQGGCTRAAAGEGAKSNRNILAQRSEKPRADMSIAKSAVSDDGGDDLPVAVEVSVPEGFHIDDETKASWAARKILEARAYGQRVKKWADAEMHRADREEQWLMHRFGQELESWARQELERRGNRSRSVPLPGGTLAFRRVLGCLEIVDEVQLITWCKAHLAEALRVTVEAAGEAAKELIQWQRDQDNTVLREKVLREPLMQHLQESGEVPEGADVRPAEERFFVK